MYCFYLESEWPGLQRLDFHWKPSLPADKPTFAVSTDFNKAQHAQ